MRTALLAVLAAAGALAGLPSSSPAAWSAPQDLGTPTDYVTPSGVAPLSTGAAVAWTSRGQPADAGGLPGAVSVTADPASNDGELGRTAALESSGRTRVRKALPFSYIAGPVTDGTGGALALGARVVGGDDDGNRYVTLSLVRISATGVVVSTRRLVRRAVIVSADMASDARGRAVIAWSQTRPFLPGKRSSETGPHAFQDLHTLKTVSTSAAGRPGPIRTLERTWAYDTDYGGQVTVAAGADGRAVVGFVAGHGGGRKSRSIDAFIRRPGRQFGGPRRVGPQLGGAAVDAAFSPTGAAVLAWGTQDGGEEANEPWTIRAVTIRPALDRWNAGQQLEGGRAVDRPVGTVTAAGLPNGSLAVGWSAVTGTRGDVRHPVRVAVSSQDGRFGWPFELAPDGAIGDLAAAPDGRLLATWATVPDYDANRPPAPTQAMSSVLPQGAASFGSAEPLADPDVADAPLAAFLPDGRAVAVWAARPGGKDPSLGIARTSVVRLAVRPAG